MSATTSIRIAYKAEVAYSSGMGALSPATGDVDLSGGHDWSGGNSQTFVMNYDGGANHTITLDASCATLAAVIVEVQAGIDAEFTSDEFTVSSSGNFITIGCANAHYFNLVSGDGLTTMGLDAGRYTTARAKAPCVAGDVSNLTVFNQPIDTNQLGGLAKDYKRFHGPGRAADHTISFLLKNKHLDMETPIYVQNTTWMTAAISETAGGTPTSYIFHIEILGVDGAWDYFDICGCVIKTYKFEVPTDDFPKETLTWLFNTMVDSVAVTSLAAPDSSQPSTIDDCGLTVDSDTIDFEDFSLTIELERRDVMKGSYRHTPFLKWYSFEVDITMVEDASGVLGDTLAAQNLVTVVVNNGQDTMQLENMYNDEENLFEVDAELTIKPYKIKLVDGGDVSPAIT